jgi:glycosidase
MKKTLLAFSLICIQTIIAFGQSSFAVHPDWVKSANIYEVNIRQYTPEGTFKAFEPNLQRLKDMGVDILWIMPIYPIGQVNRKGALGSYYAVKDYRAVNPEFGTLSDLKGLVKHAHELGMKVILDWVANHSAPDNNLVTEHPDWYTHDSTGKIVPPVPDWTDVSDFNYDKKDLWNYQIESLKYWVREADVDGFRCDVAMMVPLDFWKQAREELDKVKKVFMLAEAEGPEFYRNGFDMTYSWELLNLMNDIAKGNKHAADIETYIKRNDSLYNKANIRMLFTTNHDENSWNGSEYERLKAGAKCYQVLCATLPGMPLVYSGQESGLSKRLKFFDKDTIDWDHYPLQDFYKTLLDLKKANPELWNGTDGGSLRVYKTNGRNMFAFGRMKDGKEIVVVLNLSGSSERPELKSSDLNGRFKNVFDNQDITLSGSYRPFLSPWQYIVLNKE